MAGRVTLEVGATLVLTILLAWGVFGLFALTDSGDPVGTFLDQVPRVLFGLMGIALGLWAIMLIIGSIAHRYRAVGWRIGTHILSLVIAVIINVGVLAIVTMASSGGGGWELLLVGIAVAAGAVLLVSGVVAVLVVELAILRPRTITRSTPPVLV
jgi:hypothetical protein